ncbi:MAG: AmmeMemoRadiSam system protein B [Candidatus Hydrogenedentes bacterium]|nr:AmmeMemoRadiSam system protein B [Candidatus Hydrogenedentota bacterium]
MILVRDMEGYVEQQILLSPLAFFIASQLDGLNTVTDIQYLFATHFDGQMLTTDQIEQVTAYLDEHGFLSSDRFLAIRQRIEDEFRKSEIRKPYLAGKSYPTEPDALRKYLDELFVRDGGPGERPQPGITDGLPPLRGLITPHIDLERGGHCYAHGYLRLCKQNQVKSVFIFGVAHVAPPVPIILTRKHFETPLGVVRTDQEIVECLAKTCAWDPFEFESIHRTEHSIEFQVLMLAHLFGTDFRIVPMLCGPFVEERSPTSPDAVEPLAAFLRACRDLVKSLGDSCFVIAGADLAHVGIRFGDDFEITDGIVQSVESRDREDLAHVLELNPTAFYRSVMKDRNQRRVCGINCIYAALKTLEGAATRAELLDYDYAPDPAGGMVSFANIVIS